jgi:hypothetical protein
MGLFSFVGDILGDVTGSTAAANKNAALQKEFAQKGIQWRVEDAKKAGIAPLAALGASLYQAQPTYTGSSLGELSNIFNMGQDVTRAFTSTRSNDDRSSDLLKLQIEGAELDNQGKMIQNQYAASQLAKLSANQVGPALPSAMDAPISGQADSHGLGVSVNPVQANASRPGVPGQEAGAVNDFSYVRTADGGLAIVPSLDAKQRIEDQIIPEVQWQARNLYVFQKPPAPGSSYGMSKGQTGWWWNPLKQEWRPKYGRWPKF